jgi:hypothetical protein
VVNGWVAGDISEWRAIVERAVSYERRLPLQAERPSGFDAASWAQLVQRSRSEYAAQMRSAFNGLVPASFAAKRRAAGLPVGPLPDPGSPLADDWR